MIQGLIAKKAIDIILKKVMEKREVKKLRKYVEEDNELDIQVRQMQKTIAKQGKYIEELEKNEAIDKKLLRYLTVKVKKFDLETNYFGKKEDTEKKESAKN